MSTQWLSSRELAAWVRLVSVLELLPSALDAQLRRDSGLTHFDYRVLSMLSEAEAQTLRMAFLARITNATLPRLSHVVQRLETRGYIRRFPCPEDGRATNAQLTEQGWKKVQEAAPGHVATVRGLVVEALDTGEVDELSAMTEKILQRLDPTGAMRPVYEKHDESGSTPITDDQ